MPESPVSAADRDTTRSDDVLEFFVRWFPWAVIAYLAWFAILFAQERLHGDAANFLLHIADTGTFFINHGRWIMPLSQWMAVLGTHLGIPMSGLIALFSLGNVATLLVAYSFVRWKLKDRMAGLALVATQMVGLSHALFCPVFEFYFGAMLLVVLLAVLRSTRLGRTWRAVLLAVLLFFVLSSHFLAMVVACMVLVLVRVWREPRLTGLFALVIVVHLVIRMTVLSGYDPRAIDMLILRYQTIGWTWLFAPGRLAAMATHGILAYPDTMILAAVTAAVLVVRKDGLGLTIFLAGLLLLYVLLGLYFPDGTHMIYREIVDYPISVWVLLVLWRRVMVHDRHIRPLLMVLFLAFGFRTVQPLRIAEAYTQRVAWMTERIAGAHDQGIRRGMVPNVPVFQPADGGQALPGLDPMQAMLISACEGPDAVMVLVPATSHDTISSFAERWTEDLEAHGVHLPEGRGTYFSMPDEPFKAVR